MTPEWVRDFAATKYPGEHSHPYPGLPYCREVHTVPQIVVTYHDGTPAINVKDRHSGQDFVIALERIVGANAAGIVIGEAVNCRYPSDMRDLAYQTVASEFWQTADTIAAERGLGDIRQAGRSGGWLELVDDPTYGGDDDADPQWLAGYRALRDWADDFLSTTPERVARVVHQAAMDRVGEGPALRLFATHRRELTLREYRATEAASFYTGPAE